MINSLSGEEVEKLKEQLETITEAFSSFEFDDEEEVENEGTTKGVWWAVGVFFY